MTSDFPFGVERFTPIPAQYLPAFRVIYLDGFPPHERAEFSELVESVETGTRWFFGATRAEILLGFATLVPNVARGVHLLEYLAVARAIRNEGIGGQLLDDLVRQLRAQDATHALVIEAEAEDGGDEAERALRRRRIAFYQRHGAQLIPGTEWYRAPNANDAGSTAMKLMWLALDTTCGLPPKNQVRDCVRGIYTRDYGLPPKHPLMQAMERACDDRST